MTSAVDNVPSYTSLMMGRNLPRGFDNLAAIDPNATMIVQGEVIPVHYIFRVIEVKQQLMNQQERSILLAHLNPRMLQRYPLEMPFRIAPNPEVDQNFVEVFYGPNRYLYYCEFADDAGLQRLVRRQQIPCDESDPTQHIQPLLTKSNQALLR